MTESVEENAGAIFGKFFKLAIPATLTVLVNMLVVTVNLVFVGHLNDASKVASVGLGNMIIIIFANAAFIGMNSGMETLVCQAYGAKNQSLCGEYYQRGRTVIILYWVPLTLIFIAQSVMLRLFGQQPRVIELTQAYLYCMLPAACIYGLNDIQNKFLIQMNKSHLIFTTQLSALVLHILFNYLFVTKCHFDIYGCALATTITWTFIYLVNNWKLHNESDLQEALRVSIFDPKVRCNMSQYLSIGLPNMFTIIIEFICYEISILYLGHIGIDNQATQIILLNFFSIILMISFGYQQATCALVGQQIGAYNVFQAKKIWHMLLLLFGLSDIVLWCLLFWNRFEVINIYTSEKKVQKLTNYTIWITLVVIIESFMKNSIMGVIKALEQQQKALFLNLIVYIVITLPLAFCLAFVVQRYDMLTDKDDSTNNRGIGIWIAFVIGAGLQTIGYLVIINLTDWWHISELSRDRLKLSTKLLSDEVDIEN